MSKMLSKKKDKLTPQSSAGSSEEHYVLRLYIAGNTVKSNNALINLKKLCEEEMSGKYELTVIDLYQTPKLAKGDQIIAVPTLIRKLPMPLRMIIGDLSDKDKILIGLDIKRKS